MLACEQLLAGTPSSIVSIMAGRPPKQQPQQPLLPPRRPGRPTKLEQQQRKLLQQQQLQPQQQLQYPQPEQLQYPQNSQHQLLRIPPQLKQLKQPQQPQQSQQNMVNYSPLDLLAIYTERRYQQEIEASVGTNHNNTLTMLSAVASEVRSRGTKRSIEDVEGRGRPRKYVDQQQQPQQQLQHPQSQRLQYPQYPPPQQLQYPQIPQQQNVVNYSLLYSVITSAERQYQQKIEPIVEINLTMHPAIKSEVKIQDKKRRIKDVKAKMFFIQEFEDDTIYTGANIKLCFFVKCIHESLFGKAAYYNNGKLLFGLEEFQIQNLLNDWI
ncbi:132_t:CDS:2 [Diversispora eburnea]|uniref:132_t:CDS:1 n=1 Tax=Diversispora eburnea TaxID=1213867 RepID=A0A9N8YV82_9GLOM|nr:132_t:CDS:2 [Diversispora eburnea]